MLSVAGVTLHRGVPLLHLLRLLQGSSPLLMALLFLLKLALPDLPLLLPVLLSELEDPSLSLRKRCALLKALALVPALVSRSALLRLPRDRAI